MLQYLPVALIIVAVANLVIGGIIFARKSGDAANRAFLLLTLGVALWSAGIGFVYLTGDTGYGYFYTNVYYFGALLIAVAIYLFSKSQQSFAFLNRYYLHLLVPLGYAVTAAIQPGVIVVLTGGSAEETTVRQPIHTIYAVIFTAYFFWSLRILYHKLQASIGRRRHQLIVVTSGIFLAGLFGLTFNLFLPALGIYKFIWVGPLFSILFLLTTAYAVVRYKLFDLRVALARALAYVLALSCVMIFYAVTLLVVGLSFFEESRVTQVQNLIYIGLAVLLTFTFQPLKNFFDVVTNNLFFNKSYKPEQVIQEFGDAMLGSIELESLTTASFMVLNKTFSPSKVAIVIDDDKAGTHYVRSEGGEDRLTKPEVRHIAQLLNRPQYRQRGVIDIDDLQAHSDSQLLRLFEKHGIAVATHINTPQRDIGYLLIGHRQNGAHYGSTDMYVLGTISDELALAVENSLQFKQITTFNSTLQRRIDEATHELRRNNEQLHKLDQVKDEFISMASHQLRTPLTTIKGYLSMVLDGDTGEINPQQRKLLEEAFNSSQRMVYLISDFLNVSRLQTGKFELDKRPTDLAQVLSQEIEQLRLIARSRQLTLDYEPAKGIPTLKLDENKIRQVMMNFVDNAIYYSLPNGTIEVRLHKEASDIVFTVKDHGIGIPDKEQAGLFGKFYRASNARKQRPDGTGVGLYMAKKVIDAHKGEVIFSSKEGEGSTFGFRLPLGKGTK